MPPAHGPMYHPYSPSSPRTIRPHHISTTKLHFTASSTYTVPATTASPTTQMPRTPSRHSTTSLTITTKKPTPMRLHRPHRKLTHSLPSVMHAGEAKSATPFPMVPPSNSSSSVHSPVTSSAAAAARFLGSPSAKNKPLKARARPRSSPPTNAPKRSSTSAYAPRTLA